VYDNGAVGVQSNLHRGIAATGTAISHGNTTANVSSLRRFIYSRRERGAKCFFRFDAAVMSAGQRFIAFFDQILQAKLRGIHAKLAGDTIHVGFGGKKSLRLAGCAHLTARQIVRINT